MKKVALTFLVLFCIVSFVKSYSQNSDNRFKLKNDKEVAENKIGTRVSIGIDVHFFEPSLGLFVEVVPELNLIPETDVSFN